MQDLLDGERRAKPMDQALARQIKALHNHIE